MASSTTVTDAELALVNKKPDGEAYELQFSKDFVTLVKNTALEQERVTHQWVKISVWVKQNYKTIGDLDNDKARFHGAILLGRPVADRTLFFDRVPHLKSGEDASLHAKRERLKKVDKYVRDAWIAIRKHSFPPAKVAHPKSAAAAGAGAPAGASPVNEGDGDEDDEDDAPVPATRAPVAGAGASAGAGAPPAQKKLKLKSYVEHEAACDDDSSDSSDEDESMGPLAGRKERRDERFAASKQHLRLVIQLIAELDKQLGDPKNSCVVLDELHLVRAGRQALQSYVDSKSED